MRIEDKLTDLLNLASVLQLGISGISLEENDFLQLRAELQEKLKYSSQDLRGKVIRYAGPNRYILITLEK
jgi:hypothetical protein